MNPSKNIKIKAKIELSAMALRDEALKERFGKISIKDLEQEIIEHLFSLLEKNNLKEFTYICVDVKSVEKV
jgi:hypothetical protein